MKTCLATALSVSFLTLSSALADPVKIACEGETITIPGWGSGTMSVTYDGAQAGTLVVKGPHTDFSVPAASHKFESPLPPLVIVSHGAVLPAVGYSDREVADLEATIARVDCDAVLVGTPIDLGHVVRLGRPSTRARYELEPDDAPALVALVERGLA